MISVKLTFTSITFQNTTSDPKANRNNALDCKDVLMVSLGLKKAVVLMCTHEAFYFNRNRAKTLENKSDKMMFCELNQVFPIQTHIITSRLNYFSIMVSVDIDNISNVILQQQCSKCGHVATTRSVRLATMQNINRVYTNYNRHYYPSRDNFNITKHCFVNMSILK